MKKICLFFGLFLFFCVFVFADEVVIENSYSGEDLVDVTEVISPEMDAGYVSVQNVDLIKEEGISTLTFQKTDYMVPNGAVSIGENSFDNVASVEGKESFLKVDERGEVSSAELYMSSKGDNFILGGKEIYAPPYSKVTFDGENVHILVPEGKNVRTTFGEGVGGEATFEGKNMQIFSEENGEPIYFDGKIHYDGENFYIKSGEVFSQDGLTLEAKDKINFYFDGEAHSGNSLSLGDESFVFSCGDNPDIGKVKISGGESKYYDLRGPGTDMGWDDGSTLKNRGWYDKRDLTVGLTEADSSINFFGRDNPMNSDIPAITASGGYEIETGRLHLIAKDGRVQYNRDAGEDMFSRELVINDYSNDKYARFIQIGENSNLRFGVSEKPLDLNIPSVSKGPMNNFNLKYFSEMPEAFGTYEFGTNEILKNDFLEKRDYLMGAQEVLNNKLIEQASSDSEFVAAIEGYGGKVPISELDSFVDKFASKNYYLTPEVRDYVLEDSGYGGYVDVMEAMREMVPYYETVGTDQDSIDLDSQYYGIRQAFLQYFVTEKEMVQSEAGKKAVEFAKERTSNPTSRSLSFIM